MNNIKSKIDNNDNIYKILKNTPQICFKNMIYMNIELNKLNKKQFQFFPLQSNTILRHIQIDTSALIELFENKVSEVFKNIEIQKAIIWTNIFKINKTIKNYVFDYTIITDGYSTALRFLHKDYVEIKKDKKVYSQKKETQNNIYMMNKKIGIDDEILEKAHETLLAWLEPLMAESLSYFEYTTLLAMVIFSKICTSANFKKFCNFSTF